MSEEESLNAHRYAELLVRSAALFPILEIFYLLVAIALAVFVYRKHVRTCDGEALSPTRFGVISLSVLGLTGVLSLYWGFANAPFALAFSIGTVLSCVDPVAAVGFLISNLLIRPWEIASVEQMAIIPKMLGGLALASWVFHEGRARRLALLFNLPCRIFFVLALWFLISALTSGEMAAGFAEYSGSVMIAAIIFVLIANVPQQKADLDVIELSFLLAITGSILHAVFTTVTQADFDFHTHRLEDAGLTGNSNDLAALITLALPIALFRPRGPGKGWGTRLIELGSVPILMAGLILSQSRGATMAVLLSVGIIFILRSKNRRRAIALGAFGVPLLLVFMSLLSMARDAEDLQGSSESRTAFLLAGLNMGFRHPLMGTGFGNFNKLWEQYAISEVLETGHRTAHNSWVLALAETGVPGFLLLVALFITTFKRALKVHVPHPELLAALTGYGVAMTFLSHTYNFFPYAFFSLILAAAKVHAREVIAVPQVSQARGLILSGAK